MSDDVQGVLFDLDDTLLDHTAASTAAADDPDDQIVRITTVADLRLGATETGGTHSGRSACAAWIQQHRY